MLPLIAAILLGLGALGGLGLATLHLSGRHVPLWAAFIHGAAVAPGLAILIWAVVTHGKIQSRGNFSFAYIFQVQMGYALLLFLLAASIGITMFIMHGKRRRLPPALIVTHGILALSGYVLLIMAIV